MVNYYPQKTAAELLLVLDSLQKRTTTTAAGFQTLRSFQGSSKVEVEIRRVLFSLHKLDPDTYADPYASRIRRTRASYTC